MLKMQLKTSFNAEDAVEDKFNVEDAVEGDKFAHTPFFHLA